MPREKKSEGLQFIIFITDIASLTQYHLFLYLIFFKCSIPGWDFWVDIKRKYLLFFCFVPEEYKFAAWNKKFPPELKLIWCCAELRAGGGGPPVLPPPGGDIQVGLRCPDQAGGPCRPGVWGAGGQGGGGDGEWGLGQGQVPQDQRLQHWVRPGFLRSWVLQPAGQWHCSPLCPG